MSRVRPRPVEDTFCVRPGATAKPIGVYGVALGLAMAATAVVGVISTLFALGDDGRDLPLLLVVSILCGALGYANLRRPFSTALLRPKPTLTAAITAFLSVVLVSTVVYLLSDSVDRIDDALYESVTGVSTSALTLFADPSAAMGDGVLVWRSGTQWMGGFGALVLAVGLLPFLGGSKELAGGPQGSSTASSALATRPIKAIKRVGSLYLVVTSIVMVAFVVAGMSLRDAVAHGFSTVSTGGFSTRAGSIGEFDSVAIEVVTIVAMLGAGCSIALAWMIWRRAFAATRQAFELQVYLMVVVASTLWIWWLRRAESASATTGLRDAVFAVASVTTTTGHRLSDWGAWHPGAVTLLLVLMVVGGTAGSVAGGIRWIRVIGMAQFAWRELQRQLHPHSVRTVKVGGSTISEASVDRMHAQVVYVMTLGAVASMVLALFGEGITEAITLTLSALSTMGPGVSDTEGIMTAADLTRPERAVLMPVMLTGRVFLYPAFVAAVTGVNLVLKALTSKRVGH